MAATESGMAETEKNSTQYGGDGVWYGGDGIDHETVNESLHVVYVLGKY